MDLEIASIRDETPQIKAFELRSPDGRDLPLFPAGSHIDVTVVLPDGIPDTRSYSLAGDPHDRSRYEIAVLHLADGKGGSAFMHTQLKEGHTLVCSDPVNAFPLSDEAPQTMTASNRLGMENDELTLIEALRQGEETAFETLIHRYHSRLLRLARAFVPSEAVAEEVVQETWMNVLEGINRFEGRSSLKNWIFKLLTNRAKTRGMQERRYIPFTDLRNVNNDEDQDHEREPQDFYNADPIAGHWRVGPHSSDNMTPERRLLSKECVGKIEKAFRTLPPIQQKIILLRDVEGMEAIYVCALLHLSESNQRVLLHRARSKVRSFLEVYLEKGPDRSKGRTPCLANKAS